MNLLPVIKQFKWRKLYLGVLVLSLVFGFLVYRNVSLEQKIADLAKKTTDNSSEIPQLVKEVSALIKLPENETPSVATVTDVDKVKEQPFFSQSQNGDKVLIYSQAKKAILYRPSEKRLVDVAPINIPDTSSQNAQVVASPEVAGAATKVASTPVASVSATLRVALYNGTNTVGLTGTIENYVKGRDPQFVFPIKENAQKKNYDTTTVVDVSGQNEERVANLANLLQGSVGELPEGEPRPDNVDVIVILGPASVDLK